MSNSSRRAVAALAVSLFCGAAQAKVMEDTVAVVNGTPILLSDYQKDLGTAMEYWSRTEPEALRDPAILKKLREQTLEQLIDNEIVYQEGVKRKIKVRDRDVDNGIDDFKKRFSQDETGKQLSDAEAEAAFYKQLKTDGISYSQFRDKMGKHIMASKLIDEAVKPKVKSPDEKEVRGYFDRIAAYLESGSTEAPKGMSEEDAAAFRQIAQQVKALSSERVRVSRILIKISPGASENEKKRALKTIEEIRSRLIAGTSTFAEVARAESEDPQSAAQGGDVGTLVRGVAPPEFEKAAFSLPVGEISAPVLTDTGYNLIRVQEKRAAEKPEFDHFKDDLSKFMMNVGFQKELEDFVKSLKAKAVIERNLPPS